MKFFASFLIFTVFLFPLLSQETVKEINFLERLGMEFNGLGPLMIKADNARNRLVLINTNSSSVSIINGISGKVKNIPTDQRVPQYLKEESFIIEGKNGNIYLIGSKNLCIVNPDKKESFTFSTGKQFEMVAVDEFTGNCFLAGRESKNIAMLIKKTGKIKQIKLFNKTEIMMNLNQTPPPPIRKIVADTVLNKVFIFDGFNSTLFTLDMKTGKKLGKRKLKIKVGKRFHFAGYNYDTHFMYLITETGKRKVIQALKIDCLNGKDLYVDLPGLSEAVGITYNSKREEVYIPYDNHPVVHIVNFLRGTSVTKVTIPSYGNDASVINYDKNLLYVASWAYGEIYVIDLLKRELVKRIKDVGIIPHMFSIAFLQKSKKLFIPLGASAVNGSFGAAVTTLDTETWRKEKINTGWGPLDLIRLGKDGSFLVFNSENEFAHVTTDGKVEYHNLPFPYPTSVAKSKNGNIFLSYGPHQSYWPVVYIWGAKNGILEIEKDSFRFFDRRIARLAQKIIFDKRGGLYGLQNSWGKENIFLTYFPNGIRIFAPQERVYFYSKIQRENVQRVLKYDEKNDLIYIVKTGEKDTDRGTLLIINAKDNKLIRQIDVGLVPTDLCFDNDYIYISNFDSDNITKIDKKKFTTTSIKTGWHPLKVISDKKNLWVLNHSSHSVQSIGGQNKTYSIPDGLFPDNFELFGKKLYITTHKKDQFRLFVLETETGKLSEQHRFDYPYGDTSFDKSNTAFYLRGQFGDSIYEISKIKKGNDGKIWVTDLLSGKLLIINNKS